MPEDHGQLDPAEALMREVGSQLRGVRLERGENLEEVAEYLRIKPTYLYGLEQGDLSVMPGRTYALGFLRSYADYLGFDGDDLIAQIKWTVDNLTGKTRLHIRTPLPESRLPKAPVVVVSLAVLAGIYAGWSYINRTGELVVETVAEVPDDLRRLVRDASPASGAGKTPRVGDVRPTAPQDDVAAVAEGAGAPPLAAPAPGPLPGANTDPPLQPSGQAALPPAEVAPELAPLRSEPAAPNEERETSDFEILPSMTPLTGARDARNLQAELPAALEGTARPAGATALASGLRGEHRSAPVPEAGPEDPGSAAEPPVVRVLARVPEEPDAPDRARDSLPASARVVPAGSLPPTAAERGGASAAEVVAALTGHDSIEEAAHPEGNGPQVLETVNADARVILRANESSWIQITSRSGDYLRDRTLEAGDLILVPNRPDLQLWTGNAGGLDVFVDGERLAPLGTVGSVVRGVSLDAERLLARWQAQR